MLKPPPETGAALYREGNPMSFKIKLQRAFPIFSKMLARPKPLVRQVIVAGAIAGDVTVGEVKKGDELVSVLNLTDLTDLTAEFTIPVSGKINNAGGTSTAAKKVLVTWIAWAE